MFDFIHNGAGGNLTLGERAAKSRSAISTRQTARLEKRRRSR
ncbi:MAG: hypothetical protein R2912_09325 [Eubacteriales bacterium]